MSAAQHGVAVQQGAAVQDGVAARQRSAAARRSVAAPTRRPCLAARWAVVGLVLLPLAGCSPSPVDSAPPAAGSCLPLPSGPASVAPAPAAPASVAASGQRIADLALECFAGGGVVRLTELRRPAIVNLWASWCRPCRTELPALQSYAAGHRGRVAVIGVDTGDTRAAGAALLREVKVGSPAPETPDSFPSLFDPQGRLLSAVGRTALPVTLFVDAGGGLRYVYNSTALDEAGLAQLAESHLGVAR